MAMKVTYTWLQRQRLGRDTLRAGLGSWGAERRAQPANEGPCAVGAAPPCPRVRTRGPGMPTKRAVMLAHERLELAAMSPARVPLRAIHASPVPGEPPAGLGVDILAVAQIQKLALQRDLSLE